MNNRSNTALSLAEALVRGPMLDDASRPDAEPQPTLTDGRINPLRIAQVVRACLCEDAATPRDDAIIVVEGIVRDFGFHPRVKTYAAEVRQWLDLLPDTFREVGGGGGWSFLNLCYDRNGAQWTGYHAVMEQLVVLGIATGQMHYCLPRKLWAALPGGMPYVAILPPAPEER